MSFRCRFFDHPGCPSIQLSRQEECFELDRSEIPELLKAIGEHFGYTVIGEALPSSVREEKVCSHTVCAYCGRPAEHKYGE